MSVIARQSTARTVMVGPVLDASGVAVTDGVVADFEGSVNGGDPAALNGSATLTHRGVGFYSLALTATDLATVGSFEVTINDTVNACPMKEITVVEEAVYDALFAASALGYVANAPVNVAQFGGSNLTSASGIPEVKVASIAANAITATSINADAITDAKVASDVTIASVTGAVGSVTGAVGSVTAGVTLANDAITAAKFDETTAWPLTAADTGSTAVARTGADGDTLETLSDEIATMDSNVDAILVDTAEIGTAGAGLTNINLPNQTMDIVGNITGNLSGSVGSVTGAVGSVTGAVGSVTGLTASDVGAIKTATDKLEDTVEDDGGTYRFTTNALEQAPTGGSAPTAATIADAVWDELLSGHVVSGSAGEALDAAGTAGDPWTTALPGAYGSGTAGKILGDNLNATVSSRATQTSVDDLPTNAELATSQASADDATLSAISALNNLSAAQVRTELSTELGRIDAAVSTRATPAQVATELGTYDGPTKAELDAAVALLATAANLAAAKIVVDAIKLKTDLIPSDPAETSDIPSAATIAAAVLTAATANPIDANVQEINDTALTGNGSTTAWGPA